MSVECTDTAVQTLQPRVHGPNILKSSEGAGFEGAKGSPGGVHIHDPSACTEGDTPSPSEQSDAMFAARIWVMYRRSRTYALA